MSLLFVRSAYCWNKQWPSFMFRLVTILQIKTSAKKQTDRAWKNTTRHLSCCQSINEVQRLWEKNRLLKVVHMDEEQVPAWWLMLHLCKITFNPIPPVKGETRQTEFEDPWKKCNDLTNTGEQPSRLPCTQDFQPASFQQVWIMP